jgi:hypothetical protein
MSSDEFVEGSTAAARFSHLRIDTNSLFVDPMEPSLLISLAIGTASADWAFVAQKLGVNPELPHWRANPRARHYTEYYNDRTKQLVADKFRIDIEHFGYEFGA